MSVRPRNSPNLQGCEIGDAQNNKEREENEAVEGKEEELAVKQNKLKLYGLYAIIFISAVGVLGLMFYLGTLRAGSSVSSSSSNGMKLAMHWAGDKDTLNRYGDKDGDACVILAECFKTGFQPDPVKYPKNPYEPCHSSLKRMLGAFDNGFYYDGTKLVGFISAETNIKGDHGEILLYNVCIRKEERGKSIGKYMVPQFTKEVVAKRVPKSSSKTYVGLSVNFESSTSVSAFALYSKLGFIRWWQPCSSASDLDFNVLEKQESDAKSGITTDFPIAKYMLRDKEFAKTQISDGKGKVLTNMCMVMMMGKGDFASIGQNIKDAVQEALKSAKSP